MYKRQGHTCSSFHKLVAEMMTGTAGQVSRIVVADFLGDTPVSYTHLVKKAYPEAKVFASHLPEITIAQKNPDTVSEANDLNGTDVGIVRGEVGAVSYTHLAWRK